MSWNWSTICHGLIAAVWLGMAIVIAVRLGMLGSEEHLIAQRRGEIAREQAEIAREHQQLRAHLTVREAKPRIDQALRNLRLELDEQVRVASLDREEP